ncbi:MAG: DNA translocase FtsK 4TM domain-containing protein [Bryobacteraceae bacterium]|nr:DNA translocase FtsK 4TM domain-containing protein [Bryobacteraceae bacterium]
MNILGPSRHARLNEAVGVVFLFAGIALMLALVSYHPDDPSFNTAALESARPQNIVGRVGAHVADLALQILGLGAFVLPVLFTVLAWKWVRSRPIEAPFIKVAGSLSLLAFLSAALSLGPDFRPFGGVLPAGGLIGVLLADSLVDSMNPVGAALFTGTCLILSLYLVSAFSVARAASWLEGPLSRVRDFRDRWRERSRERAAKKAEKKAAKAARKKKAEAPQEPDTPEVQEQDKDLVIPPIRLEGDDAPPWEEAPEPPVEEIPIRTIEDAEPPARVPALQPPAPISIATRKPEPPARGRQRVVYDLPPTDMLNEPPARNAYDSQELKEIAARIKAKFEEFNVFGSVVQINPGPVVTTFEFKPEAGIKYSRITTLTEDLCLGLQAESILIERIPGKPTVGIEVPNSKMEVISLRQILESDEFRNSPSRLTISLGKDINGRIKVATLETMPHLLIAGSTGSGKSVMLNTLIMSILYKSTPDEVRMIMVDPKRLEMGLYEGIPHLLTPVITDPKKATNALRNAVLEMERRLKLLASQGVRNIDQFNKKVRALQNEPRHLFEEDGELQENEELRPLPYILIIIDELADLMMLERAGVEESVTRLAQMARAVGMHLVLATQRPSVDVITGLIKANFPARISFRVATRVDSRTVLDTMGAEHLLGRGDMLFLPPGSSRLVRVHGAFVTESEINRVVDFWKQQAQPDYDQSFLAAPPSEDENAEAGEFDGEEDPLYQDAVRVVLEMGKASTSILQRRLRLGYGRAARILDMMQREGIIGPPDGSRPREVLKRPDWLEEVENQLR